MGRSWPQTVGAPSQPDLHEDSARAADRYDHSDCEKMGTLPSAHLATFLQTCWHRFDLKRSAETLPAVNIINISAIHGIELKCQSILECTSGTVSVERYLPFAKRFAHAPKFGSRRAVCIVSKGCVSCKEVGQKVWVICRLVVKTDR